MTIGLMELTLTTVPVTVTSLPYNGALRHLRGVTGSWPYNLKRRGVGGGGEEEEE